MADSKLVHFTNEGFEADVLKSDVPVLVDFTATWCGPCRALAPILEQVAKDYEGRVKVGKVDVDECPDLAAKYRVSGVPTVLVIKEGKVVGQSIGLVQKTKLADMLDRALG
jgi:thioredoxin 1